MNNDKNNAAPDPQPAELAEQQGDSRAQFEAWAHAQSYRGGNIDTARDPAAREWYVSYIAALAWRAWKAALAATGKQQVGEVQGDALARFEAWVQSLPAQVVQRDDDEYTVAAAPSAWDAWQAALAARQPGAQEPRADLVPGIVRCAKCAFQLARTTLYMGSGTVGAGDSKTEPCPNGCGPLWPVTWETWAREGWAEAERLHMEKAAAPPAQGIDLGQFRRPVEEWRADMERWMDAHGDFQGAFARDISEAGRLLALIDQRDAAPGVGNG